MFRVLKTYFVPIAGLLFSIILKILSSTSLFDTFISGVVIQDRVSNIKDIIEVIDYLIFVVPLGLHTIIQTKDAEHCRKVIMKFGYNQRELVSHLLIENGYIEGSVDDINIRVFRKRFGRLVLEDNMKICSRDIAGKLSFSIKEKEGLCTKAFLEGYSMLEMEDASKAEYNLSLRQNALTGQLKFIVAVPIASDSKKVIKRVICFDSFQRIAKEGCEQGILKICEYVAYNLNSVID